MKRSRTCYARRRFLGCVVVVVLSASVHPLAGRAVAEEPSAERAGSLRRPDYQRDIRPILAQHCFTCHGPDAAERQAGLRLDAPAAAMATLASGHAAIVPGQASESELVRRIEAADADVVMPPPETNRPLSDEQKRTLRQWIDSGAHYAEHWAYRAAQRPELPDVSDPGWCRNAIDRFVLARLDATGRKPAAEADPVTLVRRLSLDLTGLPPSPSDVDALLADTAPDAYERLVDRLLASPHYGEKMAQDWLDLARFGDSSGYQDDGDRPNSPYRDYVIQAFNSNMPFDQFTIENLAGDLLPGATTWQKVASGFNRLHRHNEEGGSDPDEFQVVYAVDRTNTLAATWMGITLGCAQCHDHKYDPISQREYYQLYAFFNSLQGEVVISKSISPPQIAVPSAQQQRDLDEISNAVMQLECRQSELQAQVSGGFEEWIEQQKQPSADPPALELGAAGGVIARSSHAAWYGDMQFASALTLEQAINARGRLVMPLAVNNVVYLGHFRPPQDDAGTMVGLMAAEGPRFFACIVLQNGERRLSEPIHGELGVEYTWSYEYDPHGGTDDPADADGDGEGLLTLRLTRGENSVGGAALDLQAADRGVGCVVNAFGLSYPGAGDDDSPLELFIDDVEYVITSSGTTRQQLFSADPHWTGVGNTEHGHRFGFDATGAATSGVVRLTAAQILALGGEPSELLVQRLRELYIAEQFPELRQLAARLDELARQRAEIEGALPKALVWDELHPPRPAHVLARGDYRAPGELVERAVPSSFPPLPAEGPRDRLALARWLVDGRHPLTARVAVNRLWKQCFGAGLVRTPEDFGVRGEAPTHPELLDWLAVEFAGNPPSGGKHHPSASRTAAWDIKHMLRLIVTSAAYRQSSVIPPDEWQLDPENRLLARGARFRLSAEEIRDMALSAAGLLTREIGGRSVYPYQPDHFYRDKEDDPGEWRWPLESDGQLYRRGLYTFIRRTTPYPAYQVFDAPTRGECTVARSRTNTPLQALVTLNNPMFAEAGRVLGERMACAAGGVNEQLRLGFRRVLARGPTPREEAILIELFETERTRYRADPAAAAALVAVGQAPHPAQVDPIDAAAWAAVATALLNVDEAVTRE